MLIAAAAPNPYLAQGRNYFQALAYEKCVQVLDRAHSWPDTPKEELAEIELYTGLCQLSLGKTNDARDRVALACRIDPTVKLPPAASPKVEAMFDELCPKPPVDELKHAPVAPLPAAPAEVKPEIVEAPPPPVSHAVPKIALLAAGGAAGIASLALYITSGAQQRSSMDVTQFWSDRNAAWSRAQAQATASLVSLCVGAALLVAGTVLAFAW